LQDDIGSRNNGANTSLLRIEKRRKNDRKPNPFVSKEQHGDMVDDPAWKATDTASITAKAAMRTTRAADATSHGETIELKYNGPSLTTKPASASPENWHKVKDERDVSALKHTKTFSPSNAKFGTTEADQDGENLPGPTAEVEQGKTPTRRAQPSASATPSVQKQALLKEDGA
jgi:hypothetical protein